MEKIIFQARQKREYIAPKRKPLNLRFSPTRVLYYTDAHDRHDLDKDRFVWLGKYARDHKPDIIVNGGDTFDVDSLNSHVGRDTKKGIALPDFEVELASLNMAMDCIELNCPENIPRYITLGNHEERVYTEENKYPQLGGILSNEMEDVFHRHNYKMIPYRSALDINGVWFTHCPHNAMRKAIGGINGTATAAKASPRSIVFGHTHKKDEFVHHQSGYDNVFNLGCDEVRSYNNYIRAYNGGCFMPHNYKMNYAKASQTSWHYGMTMLYILDGEIIDTEWISLLRLESLYG